MAGKVSSPKPQSVTKIVVWGALTGLALWQPMVWCDLLPLPWPAGIPSAPNGSSAPTLTPKLQALESPIPRFEDPPLMAGKPRRVAGNSPLPPAEDSGALPEPSRSSTNSQQPELKAPTSSTDDRKVEPLKLDPPVTQSTEKRDPDSPRVKNTSSITGSAVVRLQQPDRVSVVNYEVPIAESTIVNDESGTLQLMHELNDSNEAVAVKARELLIARGFQETHLQLAKQFTSDDASKRARLASQLPSVSGIDARLWLTWLLRDEVADVRLAAFTVLATGTDPDSLNRTIAIGRQDTDPRIRTQADQLDKARRGIR